MSAAVTQTRRGDATRPRPTGGAGTRITFGEIESLDENRRAYGRNWRGRPGELGTAQKMLTNVYVGASRDGVVDLVVRGEWDFEPGADTPEAKEAAAYQRYIWFECLPWKRNIGRIGRNLFTFGHVVEELTDEARNFPIDRFPLHPGRGLGVVCTGMHERPSWSIERWLQNPKAPEQLSGIVQTLTGADGEKPRDVTIPSDRFLRMTWQQEGADYEGNAIQRRQLGPWFVLRMLSKIELLTHNKNHQPVPVITRGENANEDDDKKMAVGVSRWQADDRAFITLPFGYSLDLMKSSPGTAIREAKQDCKFDIFQNVGLGFLQHGQGNTHGSFALADVQNAHGMSRLDVFGDFLCDGFNFGFDGWSPVERYHRLNYGALVPTPRLVLRHMPTVDFTAILPILFDGVEIGAVDPRGLDSFARRVMRAPRNPEPFEPTVQQRADGESPRSRRSQEGGRAA